jgi:hypothetical protein
VAFAPLVPEGFSIGLFAVGLFALCITLLLIGLRGAWTYTIGALMEKLAGVKINLPGRHDIHPLRFLHGYNVAVQNDITAKIEKSQAVSGYFFHGAAIIMGWVAREVAALATDVLHWGQSLQQVKLPRLTRAMIIAAFPLPWLARRVAALVRAHAIPAARVAKVRRGISRKAIAAMIAAAIGAIEAPHLPRLRLPGALRDLGKWRTRVGRRLRRLEWLLTAAGALALTTTGLKRLGLRCLLGRNGRNVGKRLCAVDSNLLTSLLTNATIIASPIGIVELTRGTQKLMPAVTDATGWFVREAPDIWNDGSKAAIRDALALLPDFLE